MLSTIPCLIASSANSLFVQWVIGRPYCSGFSHASAIIWHSCSGVNLPGAPHRGKSCNLSATGRSDITSQRLTQVVTTFSCAIPNSKAMAMRLIPSSTIRIIFARCTTLWSAVCFLVIRLSSSRSSVANLILYCATPTVTP